MPRSEAGRNLAFAPTVLSAIGMASPNFDVGRDQDLRTTGLREIPSIVVDVAFKFDI